MSHITYLEASVVGLIQGVTELFPVSSLGHNVLIPALIGGSWAGDLNVAKSESPYLAFIVGLHVATAIAMMIYFWRDWVRIIGGFFTSIRDRQISTVDQKMAWMIILATIPVGLVGLKFEHAFRVIFGEPIRAAIFLMVNGVILFAGEKFRTKKSLAADAELEAQADGLVATPAASSPVTDAAVTDAAVAGAAMSGALAAGPAGAVARPAGAGAHGGNAGRGAAMHASGQRAARQQEASRAYDADGRLSKIGYWQALIIGSAQILALFAGISRDGVVMVTGMFRGLSRQDAARFSFLLSTPVILAAGVLKISDLTGPLGNGIRGQVIVGSILSGVGAYLSVRFLMKYFQTRTLTPFAIYCVVFGLGATIYLSLH
ncbi:MAG TPA: undecaprenyl-diphosphate phosphatase [Streptosporangiaceae bacterium]|nr:undecaprenyl-diphosphate phosphatase [Streptosporangiaceae bacterium]